ncbi:hypothetical protein [Corynebacterium sp.]|uniref:hypothetical protein n=1 Tax=Corynebacterium sp. TaxID=1720 RepID=UPI0025C445AD|nr:hypothetical protein [Corynebacterium sp.]
MTPEEAQKVQDARLAAGWDWCPDDMHDSLEEDMAATIAALRWEYNHQYRAPGVARWRNQTWEPTPERARTRRPYFWATNPYDVEYRLVRRLVGPVEVVEE